MGTFGTLDLGLGLGGVRHPDVDMWMAAEGATGAAALLDFAGQKYGFRSAAGVPRWGSVAADMVFARASAAGRWRADGVYEMVSSGVLRYDHDPVTHEPLGVRIEGAATNLLTYSELQTGLAGLTASVNATPISDFEGGRTGLALNNSAATAYALKAYGNSGVQGTLSVHMEMEDGEPPVFNSALGSASTNTAALVFRGVVVPLPYYVERVGQKVWRVSGVSDGTGALNNNTGVYQYQTNQQRRMKITGIQVETTSLRSSYIVTGASAVTRAADRLYTDLPFDPAEAGITVLWDGVLPSSYSSNPVALAFLRPTGADIDRLQIYGTQGNFGPIGVYNNGNVWAHPGTWRLFVPGARRRLAMRLTPTAISMSQLGDAVTTAALLGAIPAGMTRLDIGNLRGALVWGSTIREVAIWKGAPFSDAQMRELSAL